MKSLLVIFLTLVFTGSANAFATTFKCVGVSKMYCSSQECQWLEPTVWTLINMTSKTVKRCDETGCDELPAVFYESGIFAVVEMPGRGSIIKFVPDLEITKETLMGQDRYIEVVTVGTTVMATFGDCEAM